MELVIVPSFPGNIKRFVCGYYVEFVFILRNLFTCNKKFEIALQDRIQ